MWIEMMGSLSRHAMLLAYTQDEAYDIGPAGLDAEVHTLDIDLKRFKASFEGLKDTKQLVLKINQLIMSIEDKDYSAARLLVATVDILRLGTQLWFIRHMADISKTSNII
jgi:hypothetical protein